MLQSHFVLLVIFSICVSIVFAALMREEMREQAVLAAKMFAGLLAAAIVIGWLMYPFPI
ncbi:MAG TPA: hypothetical protein VGZ27_01880 [Vicinamibacterales bacterium]|jgi:hypothetical protein|nr:hypothetical protein [Vicinamibacterales bacterium]